jgi:peptide chain release factor 1
MDTNAEMNKVRARAAELETELQSPDVLSSPETMAKLSKEYNNLRDTIAFSEGIANAEAAIASLKETLVTETDTDLRKMAEDELTLAEAKRAKLATELKEALQPSDPMDGRDIIMEIRAGTGGDEAALFAAELFRMYSRYAERRGWKTGLMSSSHSELGGFKEVVFSINGKNVYRALKYESGVHRVQRVPETEKQGRVHTSTATVAVLPEAEEVDLKINPNDLEVDTMRAGGHGGQSVNKTESAVRITHKPTGTVVVCMEERSQQQNRAKAMALLRSRILANMILKAHSERSAARKGQIGSGDRSEKIRTYNFPQDRLTDHRVNENWHALDRVMDGELDPIIDALRTLDEKAPEA